MLGRLPYLVKPEFYLPSIGTIYQRTSRRGQYFAFILRLHDRNGTEVQNEGTLLHPNKKIVKKVNGTLSHLVKIRLIYTFRLFAS